MHYLRYVLTLIMIQAALIGCDIPYFSKEKPILTVGDRHLSANALREEIQQTAFEMDVENPGNGAVLEAILSAVIDRLLIEAYAREKGIRVPEQEVDSAIDKIRGVHREGDFQKALLRGYIDYGAWRRNLKRRLLAEKVTTRLAKMAPGVHPEEVAAYRRAHPDAFNDREAVKFQQIVTKTEEQAAEVLLRLKGGEDMPTLAGEFSSVPYVDDIKRLPWIERGDMDESMGKVLFSLEEGVLGPVTRTPYGYHVFVLVGKRSAGPLPETEATAKIEALLAAEKWRAFYVDWAKGLRKRYPVRVNREKLKTLGLG